MAHQVDEKVDMQDLAARFVKVATPVAIPGRRLLKQGPLKRQATFKSVPRRGFLFNDVFMFAAEIRPKGGSTNACMLEMKQVLELRTTRLQEKGPASLELSSSAGASAYTVHFDSADTKAEWAAALTHAIKEAIAGPAPRGDEPGTGGDAEATRAYETEDWGWHFSLHRGTLHWAIFLDKRDTVTALLDAGTAVDTPDDLGLTGLHVAAATGNKALTVLLQGRGADVALKARGLAASAAAVAAGAGADAAVNDRDRVAGQTPLHLAAQQAHPELVSLLLDTAPGAACLEERDAEGRTPLWAAASSAVQRYPDRVPDVEECVAALLGAGADGDVCSPAGVPLLHALAQRDLVAAAGALLKHSSGAVSASAADKEGRSALHVAARFGSVGMVLFLLAAGVQPNSRDIHQDTALHLTRSAHVARVLVEHGARPALKNGGGQTATELKFDTSRQELDAELRAGRAAFAERKNPEGDGHNPVARHSASWMPDPDAEGCTVCFGTFTVTNRRHHCRRCGLLVCNACSSKRYHPKDSKKAKELVRCCDGCYNLLYRLQVPVPPQPQEVKQAPVKTAPPSQTSSNKSKKKGADAAKGDSLGSALENIGAALQQRQQHLDHVEENVRGLMGTVEKAVHDCLALSGLHQAAVMASESAEFHALARQFKEQVKGGK